MRRFKGGIQENRSERETQTQIQTDETREGIKRLERLF